MNFNESHKTAKKRKSLSVPARILYGEGLLVGKCLDFGCGYGLDAAILGMHMYDPYYHKCTTQIYLRQLLGGYDTIMCNYVLNVVHPNEEPGIIHAIESLLAPGGHAYITVRRDTKLMNKNRQRMVKLDLPVLYEDKRFCIYETWSD